MRITAILLLLYISGTHALGQQLAKTQAIEDLRVIQQGISQYNPGLYAYNPDFDTRTEAIIEAVSADSLSFFTYFQAISRIVAESNEGHVALGDWEDTVHQGFLGNTYVYLPLSVQILQEKVYVWEDYSNELQLERGDQIMAINGQKAEAFLAKLRATTPSDGTIETYPAAMIEAGFAWMYYLYVEQADRFVISIQDGNGQLKSVHIQALSREQQIKNYRAKYANGTQPANEPPEQAFHRLTFEQDHALLVLSSFDYRKIKAFKLKAKTFYKAIFSELKEKGVENLVIDLRNNTGGRSEFASDIVPYILKAGTASPFLKKTISWKGRTKTYKMPKASKLAFTGNIYVLVNGKTYSAGSELARYLKEYAQALMIGEETGTRYEGFVAGSKQYITLPNSNVKIGIPRYQFVFPKSEKQPTSNRGLIPDMQIVYDFADLVEGKDLCYQQAMQFISAQK